jgi:type I restriction enzyme R subunit
MSNNQTHSQKAINEIDRKSTDSGLIVQEKNRIEWNASKGIAVK